MKYFVIFLIFFGLVFFTTSNFAYGIWVPQPPEKLWEKSQTIFVGNITSVNVLEFEKPSTMIENYTLRLDQYTVKIEEFVKNPQEFDEIKLRQPTISMPGMLVPHVGFDTGDRVLFYVEKLDGENVYFPESFIIPKECDAKQVTTSSRVLPSISEIHQNGNRNSDEWVVGKPISFKRTTQGQLGGGPFDYYVKIYQFIERDRHTTEELVWENSFHIERKECMWNEKIEWDFLPTNPGKYKITITQTETDAELPSSVSSIFSIKKGNQIPSPLKQIQLGVYGNDIQCRDDRVLVLKKSSELYSCITPQTVPKLFARNWALNEVEVIDTDAAELDSKVIKITGIVDRLTTPEGFEYHLIPMHEELPRIEYTGYDSLNLFATKDTVHYFLRNLEGKLVKVEGSFLLQDGKYFRHFSGLPTIPVEKLEVIFEKENLEYSIEGARLLSVTKIPGTVGINIVLEESQDGSIEITIPRDLIDAKIGENDDDFFVLIDGYEVPFTETTNEFERTLTINFEEGTKIIEVIGTNPDF